MRALFFVSQRSWNGCARAFCAAAAGLAARGHQVTIACSGGTVVASRAAALGLDVVSFEPEASGASDAWALRKVLKERFVEVVFVHGDRDQLVVGSAMRLAERGAVLRRIPHFDPPAIQRSGRLALRMAATGLLFSTSRELTAATKRTDLPALQIPSTVAPLGVSVASYDSVRSASRADLGVPPDGLLVVCSYEPRARLRLATAMRTLALLVAHHPELHLAVIGPGSRDEDLRMHTAALGVGNYVSFLGERADHLEILRAADAGWVVAGGDDAAFAYLDLMAMGIPVVSERGELPQHYVADGITGVLLSPGAPSSMASAVAAFLALPERRAAMGNAGRTRVQRDFSDDEMIDGFEQAALAASDRSRWLVR
jgi:glycosyltransferase involved in cell wall biosynthesis